jgi:HEAT repeat protein
MPIPITTTALSQALITLLQTLIERAQDRYDDTDSPVYIAIEHWARGALNPAQIQEALNLAQDQFARYAPANQRWLELFAELMQHGGDDISLLVANIWRADLFHLSSAVDVLWDQYPEIQRRVTIHTDRPLPRSWSEWIFPLSSFMGVVGDTLTERNPVFEDLIGSEEVLTLLEEDEAASPVIELPSTDSETVEAGIYINSAGTLDAYLSACNDIIAHIDPRGYPRSVNRTVPLSDVYIPLRLVPLATTDESAGLVRYQAATYRNPELDTLREPLNQQQLSAQSGVPVFEIITRHPQTLILGVSGAGKSTLLRTIVAEQVRLLQETNSAGIQIESRPDGSIIIRLSRRLPIYVDLAEFVDEHRGETLEEFIVRSAINLINNPDIAAILLDLLRRGQCILLLDGLDQVATEDQRRMLNSAISYAAGQWRSQGNHIVVTSRFEGYTSAPLPPSFKTYVVRGLDRSQIGPFLLRWSITLARMRRPLISDDDALRRAESDTLALVREVTGNPRLYHLINTPLMLRMLVSVYRPGMLMSPQRIAIYQLVADALVREWHLPQNAADRPVVLEQDVTELLGELAYWLQSSRPGGMLTEQELRDILAQIWSNMHPSASPMQASESIEGFLRHMRLNPGVLTELAPQRYGFIYHALQEYFAARYLVSSYRMAPERIRNYTHNPRWDEVIRLAVGFTALRSREDAADLIEAAILARGPRAERHDLTPDLLEDLLHRDLFFTARLLGSGIEVGTEIAETVASALMRLWLDGDRDSVGRFNLLFDSARRYLLLLDGTSASWHALQLARQALNSSDDYRRSHAVEALTFWPSHYTEGRDAIVQIGREASTIVKMAMSGALGHIGPLDIYAYRLLLNLVSDADERVSERAQHSLEAAAPVPQEALSMWIEFLRSGNPARRRISLRVLGRMGVLPPLVINELLLLLGDPDTETRQASVDVLAGVRDLPENVLTAICRAAQDINADTETRIAAIHALRRPVDLPQEVIDLLIDWTYDPDVAVRKAAIEALGTCNNLGSDVIDALVERLNDPIDSVRAAVALPLAQKGQDDPRVTHVFMHAVRDPIYTVRIAIVGALRLFPRPNDDIRQALLPLLSDREIIVREATLETISYLEAPGAEIIDYMISLVRDGDYHIAGKAVKSLARLRNLPQAALRTLVDSLRSHWQDAGDLIRDCLRAHDPLNQEIIHEIMDLAVLLPVGYSVAAKVPTGLRALALEMLGSTIEEVPSVLRILFEAARSEGIIEVQVAALRGLSHLRTMPTGIQSDLYTLLNAGPLEVRCAAAIALGGIIRNLPDPPFSPDEMLALIDSLAQLLKEITPRASWESDTRLQNDLVMALEWVTARARPSLPRLSARLEDLGS